MKTAHAGAPRAIVPGPLEAGAGMADVLALSHFAGKALMAVLAPLIAWQERASQRHHLSMIDAHGLRDVGLSRADLEAEIRRPFWRP